MFGARWQLFRLLGIPVRVDASWLIIVALLSWTLVAYFTEALPGLTDTTYWIMGLATVLSFFACIVAHEFGHALVGRAMGINFRGITLFLFGGVAEFEGEVKTAKSEFLMAIAGPAVTAVLAVGFWLSSMLELMPAVVVVLEYLARINLVMLVFNLVPAFPLDGGRVFRSLMWGATGNLRRATYIASLAGQAFAAILIGLGVLQFLTGHVFGGIWLGLIGLFLLQAARGSYQQVLIRQALHGEPVSRFMNREPIVVAPSLDLRRWVEDYVYRYNRKMFPVASNGHVEGVIGTQALANFPREDWDRITVAEAMNQDLAPVSISPDADALDALGKMQHTGTSRLLVMEGERLMGIVSLKDLLRFLDLKLELEDGERSEDKRDFPSRR